MQAGLREDRVLVLDGPASGKRAAMVSPKRIVIFARAWIFTGWKQCHGSHGFHSFMQSGLRGVNLRRLFEKDGASAKSGRLPST